MLIPSIPGITASEVSAHRRKGSDLSVRLFHGPNRFLSLRFYVPVAYGRNVFKLRRFSNRQFVDASDIHPAFFATFKGRRHDIPDQRNAQGYSNDSHDSPGDPLKEPPPRALG